MKNTKKKAKAVKKKPAAATTRPQEAIPGVGICRSIAPEDVVELVHSSGLRHIVQKNSLAFEQEMITAKTMVKNPKRFFTHPLETILGAPPVELFQIQVPAKQKKAPTLLTFGSFVAKVSGSRRIWDQALMVVDELFNLVARSATKDSGAVEFFCAADDKRLAIVCRDAVGRLSIEDIVKRLHVCYSEGVADSMQGSAGSGSASGSALGTFLVFDSCVSYYVATEKGKVSVVGVCLPLGLTTKQAEALPKNIHLLA